MAKLFIREYGSVSVPIPGQTVQIAFDDDAAVDQAPLTIGSEVKSSAFAAGTRYILITGDAIFSYKVGASPTATTNMVRFPADTVLFLGVRPGDKISVIANT